MAKKLSTLVVPVKLDTTGMNAGLSEMRSKMSRVRGSGGGGGGGAMGGSAPGFASGVVPFGVGGGSSSAAAAMAAAFGASIIGRLTRTPEEVGKLSRRERMNFNESTFAGRFFQRRADHFKYEQQRYAIMNATLPPDRQVPRFNRRMSLSSMSDMFYNQKYNEEIDRQRRFNQGKYEMYNRKRDANQRYATMATNASNIVGRKISNALTWDGGGAGGAVGAGLFAGERLLRAISPVGISETMTDLKPFETRAAGQYDIARNMKYRAMTASQGNIGMPQQFFLGIGTAAGGGMSRTEQMGTMMYEKLGEIIGGVGGLLENTFSSGVGFVEGALQRAAMRGSLNNPMNYLRQLYN